MKFFIKAAALIMLTVSLTFSACGGGGDPGGGETETPASTLFASKSYLAPGAICPNGGIQIDMGFDNNKNNVLDADEITKTEYVCNGEDASSHPFVVYTSPTPNETDVELDTVISAVFNTEMDETTITDQTFTVKDSSGNSVAGTVSYSGIVAVFTPTAPLSINKKYTVNLASTIENDNDIAMGYNHKIYFTGGKAAVVYKANGATGGTVPVDANRYIGGQSVTVKANTDLVKNNLNFAGWNTASDGSGSTYLENAVFQMGNSNVILYAKWNDSYTFETATNRGDVVTVTAGTVSFDMIYANNQLGIIIPTGTDDSGNVEITTQYFMAETEFTSAQAIKVLQWALNNNRIIDYPGVHNEVNTKNVKYGGQKLLSGDFDSPNFNLWGTLGYNPDDKKFYVVPGREDFPVMVTNYGAIMFCNWMTEMIYGSMDELVYSGITLNWEFSDTIVDVSKKGFRLPLSEEWEFAARWHGLNNDGRVDFVSQGINGGANLLTAGHYWTPGNYASGATTYWRNQTNNNSGMLATDEVAVFRIYLVGGNDTWLDTNQNMTNVKSRRANKLGFYDMSGNISEFCSITNSGNLQLLNRGGSYWNSALDTTSLGFYSTQYWMLEDSGIRFVRTK